MAEKLYYDDNLFYLNEIIASLDDALRLDIDSDLFLDKFVEDIMFVESILDRLYLALKENELLIRRAEYLRRIMRSKHVFADLLSGIMSGESALGQNLYPFFPKFRELINEQREHINEIRGLLSSPASALQPEDMVSQEEFRILLEDTSENM
ncbi:MAG: hypothetical protein JW852_00320 [Spirochaetales bacterium]|nr:hypothetical protein [Spirochaetales bacterium]